MSIGLLACCVAVRGSARALDEAPSAPPVAPVPRAAEPARFEPAGGQAVRTAGIVLYAAGALYDLYTTKRAMDAGLHEANPLLSAAGDPDRTLLRGAVAKIGFAFAIDNVGRPRGARARGAVLLSVGALQLGLGIANRNATIRERAMAPVGPPPNPIPPPSDPLRPIGMATSLTEVKRKGPVAGSW